MSDDIKIGSFVAAFVNDPASVVEVEVRQQIIHRTAMSGGGGIARGLKYLCTVEGERITKLHNNMLMQYGQLLRPLDLDAYLKLISP